MRVESSLGNEHARGARPDELYERPDFAGGWLRAAWRGPALLLWSISIGLVWFLAGALTRPFGQAHRRTRFWFLRTWGRGMLFLLGISVEVRGRPPARPTLLVSNHISYVDIPLIASVVDCAFVAKAEIAGWPLAGTLASTMHTIFVEREKNRDLLRVNQLVEGALSDGLSVVVFAEGQSTRGLGVLPFRAPLFATPARLGLGVTCACVHYEGLGGGAGKDPAAAARARDYVSFYGVVGFAEHVTRLLRAPGGFRARISFDDVELREQNRKALASEAWERVAGLFEPVD